MKISRSRTRRSIAIAVATLLPCVALHANDQTSEPTITKQNPIAACYQSAYKASSAASTGEYLNNTQLQTGVKHCTNALRHYSMRKKARAQVYMHRGLLNRHLLQSDSALVDFQKARRVGGDSPAISVNIGNIYYLNGDFERAISAYNRALNMEFPAAHKALLNRGLASERLGRAQHAIDAYVAALALQPSLNTARERLSALTKGRLRLSILTPTPGYTAALSPAMRGSNN